MYLFKHHKILSSKCRSLFFLLTSLSKLTIDWSSHVIEPTINTGVLEDDKVVWVLLLNKFEDTLIKGKLSLLIWGFYVGDTKCSRYINEVTKCLNTLEKKVRY